MKETCLTLEIHFRLTFIRFRVIHSQRSLKTIRADICYILFIKKLIKKKKKKKESPFRTRSPYFRIWPPDRKNPFAEKYTLNRIKSWTRRTRSIRGVGRRSRRASKEIFPLHARLDFEASPSSSLERTTRTISGWCSGDKYKFQLRSNTLIIPVRIGPVAIARETSRLWNPSLLARESSTPFREERGCSCNGETRQIAASSKRVHLRSIVRFLLQLSRFRHFITSCLVQLKFSCNFFSFWRMLRKKRGYLELFWK